MQILSLGAKKKASLVGAFFVSALLASLPAPARADSCRMPAGLREAQVERVVDGDTLRLRDGRSVRLIGLNTPEKARRGRPAEPFAAEATRHLEKLVATSGRRVRLQPGEQPRDRYGRTLAHAFGRDGRSWAAEQLRAGFGMTIAVAPNTAGLDCLLDAERRARDARRGVWRHDPVQPVRSLRAGGFAILEGRVSAIERNRGGLWLTLEDRLAVRIAPPVLAAFGERRLRGLEGRRVEVRGWVSERRSAARDGNRPRWSLTLAHPGLLRPR